MASFTFHPDLPALMAELRDFFSSRDRLLQNEPALAGMLDSLEALFTDRDRQLEDYLNKGLPASQTIYDCYVDPTQAANNPSKHLYTNVADAVNAEQPAHTNLLRVGFVPNGAQTPARDLSAITTWPTTTVVETIGRYDTWSAGQYAVWNMNNQAHHAPATLMIRGLRCHSGRTASPGWWGGGGSPNVIALDGTYMDGEDGFSFPYGTTAGADLCPNGSMLLARDSLLLDCGASSTYVMLWNTSVNMNLSGNLTFGNGATNSYVSIEASSWNQFSTVTTFPVNLNAPFVEIAASVLDTIVGGGPAIVNFKPTMNGEWRLRGIVSKTSSIGFSFDATGRSGVADLQGDFINVTLPAPSAANRGHNLVGTVRQALDVTGPCELETLVEAPNSSVPVTIRGHNVGGALTSICNASPGPAINYVGATRSCIVATVVNNGNAATKPYAFDAASGHNILIITGTDGFTAAGTDAGTTDLVITEAGLPPPADVALAGDVSGAETATSVDKIKGTAVSATAPTDAQVLIANATPTWQPKSISGDATLADTGALTLANSGVTAGTVSDIGTAARVTADSKGRVTTLAKHVDFSQAWLMGGNN